MHVARASDPVRLERADNRGENPVVALMSCSDRTGGTLRLKARRPIRHGIAALSHRGSPVEHGPQGLGGVGMLSG